MDIKAVRTRVIRIWLVTSAISLLVSILSLKYPHTALYILLVIACIATVLLFFSLLAWAIVVRDVFGSNKYRHSAARVLWEQGIGFLFWFWWHSLLWVAPLLFVAWSLLSYLSRDPLALACATGATACAIWAVAGSVSTKTPAYLGICWSSPQLDWLSNPWTRSIATVMLHVRYNLTVDHLKILQIQQKYRRMLDQISVLRSKQKRQSELVDFTPEKHFWPLALFEIRHRLYVFLPFLLVTSLIAFAFFGLTQNLWRSYPSLPPYHQSASGNNGGSTTSDPGGPNESGTQDATPSPDTTTDGSGNDGGSTASDPGGPNESGTQDATPSPDTTTDGSGNDGGSTTSDPGGP
ncbi:MAG: hypothetical protein GY833_06125, partial [Aestuariibacter sp.]|nr:hypothetical protein [Aestuariibacter sp.]